MKKNMTKFDYSNLEKFISEYKDGKTQYQLAKENNISHGHARFILIKNNVPIRPGNQSKKYECDDFYFSKIDCHQKAYWLGFLSADGSVSKINNQISIGLSYKDIDHLTKFKETIKSNYKTFIYDSTVKGKIYKCCKSGVYSSQMKSDLKNHNITPNKSKTFDLSNQIPDEFLNSYILGIIDGDGSFTMGNDGQIRLNLIGSKIEIEKIRIILEDKCDLNHVKITQEKRSPEMWYLAYGGNKILSRIVNYLYKDCSIFLERKKEIISHLLNKEEF